eukprot:2037320-Pyramimonas_sp.AAC.1
MQVEERHVRASWVRASWVMQVEERWRGTRERPKEKAEGRSRYEASRGPQRVPPKNRPRTASQREDFWRAPGGARKERAPLL